MGVADRICSGSRRGDPRHPTAADPPRGSGEQVKQRQSTRLWCPEMNVGPWRRERKKSAERPCAGMSEYEEKDSLEQRVGVREGISSTVHRAEFLRLSGSGIALFGTVLHG